MDEWETLVEEEFPDDDPTDALPWELVVVGLVCLALGTVVGLALSQWMKP